MTRGKQSFLGGAALLTVTMLVTKAIGALYKIPLGNLLDEQGMNYFYAAYNIYNLLLMVSTAGLPLALSRLVSQAEALGWVNRRRRIVSVAFWLFLLLGLLSSGLMFFLAGDLAGWMHNTRAEDAIRVLSPAVLCVCLVSVIRGYTQGMGDMRPTAASEIIESGSKLVVGLGLAWFIMKQKNDTALAAGGAILGVTSGCLIATLYMYGAYSRARREMPKSQGGVSSFGQTAKRLLAIAIPITIGSAGLQIITLVDAKVVMSRLIGAAGFTQGQADTLKGVYNFAQTIFNLPYAFVSPISISILPAITAQLTLRNARGARRTEESAIRIMGLITMPCAVGLIVLAQPIMALLRGYTGDTLTTAGNLLAVLGVSLVFTSVVMLTNTMMQAHGFVYLPVMNMFIGGIVKVIVNYILVGNPNINIQGAPVGTLCCYLCITVLNLFTMRKVIRKSPNVPKHLLKPLLASLIMGGVAYGAWRLTAAVTASRLVQCALPIALAAAAYVILVIVLRVVTYDDCMLLPKGEKIAKLLRIR